MVFKNLCVPVLWTKVASALEGLKTCSHLVGVDSSRPCMLQPAVACEFLHPRPDGPLLIADPHLNILFTIWNLYVFYLQSTKTS